MGSKQSEGEQSLTSARPDGVLEQAKAWWDERVAGQAFRVEYINRNKSSQHKSRDFGDHPGWRFAAGPTFQLEVNDPTNLKTWTVKTPWSEQPYLLENARSSQQSIPFVTEEFVAWSQTRYTKYVPVNMYESIWSSYVAKTLATALMATNRSYQAWLEIQETYMEHITPEELQSIFFGEYNPHKWLEGVSIPEAVTEQDKIDRKTVTSIIQTWMENLAEDDTVSQVEWK